MSAPATTPSLSQVVGLLREPELALWVAFLVFTPFYVFKSGLPQPADVLTLIILPVIARRGLPRIPEPFRGAVIALFVFAGYAAVVNLLWGMLLLDYNVQKVGAIGFASFYLFNAYVFTICVFLYLIHGTRLLVVTAWGMVGAVGVQLLLMLAVGGSGGYREKLFFNNPNQLGYYALLAASLIAFGYKRGRVPFWLAGCALASTTLFSMLSLSKAAIIGTLTVAGVAAVRKPLLLLVTAAVLLIGMQLRDPTALIEKVEVRMRDLSQSDDTLEGRGYSRIEMHPEYLVLGAGEVGHDRHGDFGGELHSSWATVLFSYGAIGLAFFIVFMWRALKFLRPADFLFLVPIFWYGLTHHGLRFRLFWVFLAFVGVAAVHERRKLQRPRRPRIVPVPPVPAPARDETVPAE